MLLFDDHSVHWSDSVTHLENVLCNKLTDADDCFRKITDFNGYVNTLNGNFSGLFPVVMDKLFCSSNCSF